MYAGGIKYILKMVAILDLQWTVLAIFYVQLS